MCLIFVARHCDSRYPLIVAANRDEFFERPTAPADFHAHAPQVLAGRDLRCGGTWLGITRTGRFAAVTNYRDPGAQRAQALSRGELVSRYLEGGADPRSFLSELDRRAGAYNGYNLLAGDLSEMWYYSNVSREARRLEPGVYGLSNHLLDSPWPKVERGKVALRQRLNRGVLSPAGLLELLADRRRFPDDTLPDTGVGIERERELSPAFIASPGYGTRSSTVVLVDRTGHVIFVERSFAPDASELGEVRFEFRIPAPQAAGAVP